MGADVIKVEPLEGDKTRMLIGAGSGFFPYFNRNKRSLALDLKHADGLAVLYRLLASADVFVTNFPLPVRERLRIAPAHVLSLNPRLIYASFTAYGEVGDEAAKTGFDSTAYWARTGLMDMVRATEATEPARSVPGMGDHPSATGLYAAIVTALYRREKTGQGGVVQSSLLQNGLWANACFVQSRLCGEHVPHRAPRALAPNALANHYCCRDGRWFLMALHNEPRQWHGFLAAIGRADLADDPRFATSESRKQHARALVAVLDAVFAQRDLAAWRPLLDAAGVTFGGVQSVNETSSDAQMHQIGALVPFADGAGLTVSSPFHLEGETKVVPRRAPALGQHTDVVLREAGYSAEEIGRLRALGVVA
jgi:formyl-CoA transferase